MRSSLSEQLWEVRNYIYQLIGKKDRQRPKLMEMIEKARTDWIHAAEQLNFCDRDMVEYVIHEIHAKERRYMALLMQAKKDGLTAWNENELS
ncbi:hypothetical protein JOC37_000023 [Desulfohalotomaculum tongense]|uniref:DUF2508 family protein n=1 Tax=Desulforadius tongensis TaxID=1216062 RepID=UPI0019597E7D|nr:DUF2508 family protein [Desulforadius tongensis]MBM7853658.1 hypothetical protein [Desulforadius tongensis]